MSISTLTEDGVFLNNSNIPLIVLPVGVIFVWLSTSLPTTNYLWCDGSIYNPDEYSELYQIIGTSYGGTTNSPRLPNLLNRAPIGGNISGNTLASTLGSSEPSSVYNTTNLKTGGNSSLSPSQFIHTHTVTGGPFINNITNTQNTDNDNGGVGTYYSNNAFNGDFTFGETGTSTHFPPHIKVNYIIFAGKTTSATSNKY